MKPVNVNTQQPFPAVSFTLSPENKLAEFTTKYSLASSVDRDEMQRQNQARYWKELSTWAS